MRYATREIRPASALVEAADTLVEGFEATRYLQRVSDHCVELLDARAAGVMLIDGGRSVSQAAGSRDEQVALDLLEAQHGGGPVRTATARESPYRRSPFGSPTRTPAGPTSPNGPSGTTS